MADVSPSWVFVPDHAPVNAHRIKAEMAEPLRPSTAPTALSFLFGAATPNYFRASFPTTSRGPSDIFGHMGRIAEVPLNTDKSNGLFVSGKSNRKRSKQMFPTIWRFLVDSENDEHSFLNWCLWFQSDPFTPDGSISVLE
ncbi:hypothetical protein EVAR_98659_1 [Eumeta japonica]|uniref:Uncharacterized protein n=1 Tax=Eumeta variegata TaxID=151549 RepID=A0A4C1XZJ9_EUMVA|nr:hypothetical protein EVAR_98659_1 [Eumeta japonica]